VVGDVAALTHLDWEARAADLPQPAVLLNDLAAAAHGVGTLGPGGHRRICGPAPTEQATRVVIGCGTGHGQALWTEGRVVAGEGGHAGFAPEDPELAELAQAIRLQHGRVRIESVLSGGGLDELLRFAAGRAVLGARATEALQQRPSAAVVAEFAGEDPACARARSLFARALGAEAGNAALRCLPAGGVWLVGGVVEALVRPAVDPEIQAAFCAKEPVSERVRQIPLLVVQDSDIGLRGAAVVAAKLLH
jgi:glucokinase